MVTEATPEMRLASQIEPVIGSRSCDVIFVNPMLTQVVGICVNSIEQPLARGACLHIMFCAEPTWYTEMLGALMALPVRLAAKGLGTVGECTPVGSFVTLLVFPDDVLWLEP